MRQWEWSMSSSIGGREPLARNVEQVATLEAKHFHALSIAERIAARLTSAVGSATCAAIHVGWFSGWIAINSGYVSAFEPFDPYPLSFLTLVVSLEAIFLAIWILISQNQLTRAADRRAHLDLQVNLLAEQEATAALGMLRRLCEHFGIKSEQPAIEAALAQKTDVAEIEATMTESLPEECR
jgi:uncharacterized membrane protein